MTSLFQILIMLLGVIKFLVLAQVVMSWLVSFQVLNTRQPIIAQIWDGLNRLLEPLYRPVRRILPDTGAIDLAPLVVLLIVFALQRILINNIAAFY